MSEAQAGWPTWAAAVCHERFQSGCLENVISLCFLRAPDSDMARRGAITMQKQKHPNGSKFDAIVAEVPSPTEENPTHAR